MCLVCNSLFLLWFVYQLIFPISSRVSSLALNKSYEYHSASEATWTEWMIKFDDLSETSATEAHEIHIGCVLTT